MSAEAKFTILLVEDDENDSFLFQRALKRNQIDHPVQWMRDGLEALHYLRGEGQYADRNAFPFPKIIILDLKMPRLSGMELLRYLQEHPELRIIPTVVLSSSRLATDIEKAYSLGANTYFVKPADFDTLTRLTRTFVDYWTVGEKPERQVNQNP
ncbi:MAG: response regulator [Limisphaerales bacterium]